MRSPGVLRWNTGICKNKKESISYLARCVVVVVWGRRVSKSSSHLNSQFTGLFLPPCSAPLW